MCIFYYGLGTIIVKRDIKITGQGRVYSLKVYVLLRAFICVVIHRICIYAIMISLYNHNISQHVLNIEVFFSSFSVSNVSLNAFIIFRSFLK